MGLALAVVVALAILVFLFVEGDRQTQQRERQDRERERRKNHTPVQPERARNMRSLRDIENELDKFRAWDIAAMSKFLRLHAVAPMDSAEAKRLIEEMRDCDNYMAGLKSAYGKLSSWEQRKRFIQRDLQAIGERTEILDAVQAEVDEIRRTTPELRDEYEKEQADFRAQLAASEEEWRERSRDQAAAQRNGSADLG